MRLGIFAEDSRLLNGAETHFLAEIDYDDCIPWKIIHEIERFLHLRIIVCDTLGTELLKNDFCHMEQLDKDPECIECISQKVFLQTLHYQIVEHFGDCLTPDQVDAVFLRKFDK